MIARPCPDQLRLATVLAHSTEGIELELWLGGADPLVVSRRAGCRTDLSPCELRRLVLGARAGGAAGVVAGWTRKVTAMRVAGPGVTPARGGVWRVDRDGVGSWVWATTLSGSATALTVADAATGLLADGEADAAVVECCGAAVRVDDEVGASVVSIEEPCREIGQEVGRLARRLAACCRVEELLHDAERMIRNAPPGL